MLFVNLEVKFYKNLFRPVLMKFFEAEEVHGLVMYGLRVLQKLGVLFVLEKFLSVNEEKIFLGLKFKNGIGLAAGFDKDGKYLKEIKALGFGFVEVGTVTPKAQIGNEKPRLFRLIEDEALINRMGFNNSGVEVVLENLKNRPKGLVVGVNIGKNKTTENEFAYRDYVYCFERLHEFADFFVVNVSSPNTPGLRELQEKNNLNKILSELMKVNLKLKNSKPILLKISPDLTDEQLREIVEVVKLNKLSGIVATNTTIARKALKTNSKVIEEIGVGGLSGRPIRMRAIEIVKKIREFGGSEMLIIGVGGIFSFEDRMEMIEAGADLVEAYTGLVYEGPFFVKNLFKIN